MRLTRTKGFITVFCLVLLASHPVAARTWNVLPDSTGDAPTIQAAVDLAQYGDVILLFPGLYSVTSKGNDGLPDPSMVHLKDGLTLRGRDGAQATILDGEGRARVIYCQGGCVLEGVTVKRGRTLGTPPPSDPEDRLYSTGRGGGLFAKSNSVITHCYFEQNTALAPNGGRGGAIWLREGTVRDCTFLNNSAAATHSSAGRGGAICAESVIDTQRVSFEYCIFVGNAARTAAGEPAFGGTVANDAIATISNCTFAGNYSGWSLAPMDLVYRCIVYRTQSPVCGEPPHRVGQSVFWENAADATCLPWPTEVDPQFCAVDPVGGLNFLIQSDSPCAPSSNEGVLIGARPVGCNTVPVQSKTWSAVRDVYR